MYEAGKDVPRNFKMAAFWFKLAAKPSGGKFLAGISGNPGGRPREVGDVREMARDHTEEAVETLVDLMRHAKSDAARGAPAQALLDRVYGKSVAVSMDIVDEG